MKKFTHIILAIVLLCMQNLFAQTKADTIHVSHYDINLEIRNFAQEEINGCTDVKIEAKVAPLSSINLDLWALSVDSVKNGNESVEFLHQGRQLKIELPFSTEGETKTIRVYYHEKPVKDPQWGGFFFTSDFVYNMGVGMGSYPHSIGRFWFPCVDEFTDKSTYTFNITTDADKKAVCGGMLIDSTDFGDAKRWTWELADPIPTYLASVAVGNYLCYKDTIQGIEDILLIEIYADPVTLAKVPESFVNLKTFIHTYEKRWGAHQWQRIGYVVVPFTQGAMEHATNIAYPKSYVNGNITQQSTIAHELAHSWFGNLITCATSQNMWINEGFARYGEYLCYEALDPTLQKYNTEIRKLHGTVISNSICREYALDNVPPTETYNSTLVYDKGGWTAFTLRNYMGDDLFFSSITQFLDENRYGNVDSEEFFNKLSDISGMDLSGFYLAWVHQPGFLNFNIDSVKPIGNNKYEIAFKQRLYYAPDYTKNYSVDVVFVSSTGATSLKKLWFSGESDIVETELPFEPVFWAINPYFKRSDICYDYTETISSTGNKDWGSSAYFSIKVDEIDSESIIRIEYNPFTPTTAKNSHPDILRISERRFWRIGFLKYNTMQALYSFSYNSSLDKELLNGYTKDNLVLLYRKDAAHDWQIIPATVTGSAQQGKLETTTLLSGEYTLGISDKVQVKEWEDGVEVYPNPATGELIVTSYELQVTNVEIFDVFGRKLSTHHLITSSSNQIIDISRLPAGTYILEIVTTENIIRKKFIKL